MVGMKNKIILIILIGVLSLQIFPTQWLSMISDDTTSIQYLASGESEEDIDDEPGKDAKIKFLENNFLIVSNSNIHQASIQYCNYLLSDIRTLWSEVFCPPPNFC
jgi:hypothetical protein